MSRGIFKEVLSSGGPLLMFCRGDFLFYRRVDRVGYFLAGDAGEYFRGFKRTW